MNTIEKIYLWGAVGYAGVYLADAGLTWVLIAGFGFTPKPLEWAALPAVHWELLRSGEIDALIHVLMRVPVHFGIWGSIIAFALYVFVRNALDSDDRSSLNGMTPQGLARDDDEHRRKGSEETSDLPQYHHESLRCPGPGMLPTMSDSGPVSLGGDCRDSSFDTSDDPGLNDDMGSGTPG